MSHINFTNGGIPEEANFLPWQHKQAKKPRRDERWAGKKKRYSGIKFEISNKIPKVTNAKYRQCISVSRTMHLHQLESCQIARKFLTDSTTEIHKTLYRGNATWFRGISLKQKNQTHAHDWFGNVRCDIPMDSIIEQFNLFYVDFIKFDDSQSTRILVTTKMQSAQHKKINLKQTKEGDPIYYENGQLFMSEAHELNGEMCRNHNVHFIFDESLPLHQLYSSCDKVAVNHSRANQLRPCGRRFGPHQCLTYNGGKRTFCPTPYGAEVTSRFLDAIHTWLIMYTFCRICIDILRPTPYIVRVYPVYILNNEYSNYMYALYYLYAMYYFNYMYTLYYLYTCIWLTV